MSLAIWLVRLDCCLTVRRCHRLVAVVLPLPVVAVMLLAVLPVVLHHVLPDMLLRWVASTQ